MKNVLICILISSLLIACSKEKEFESSGKSHHKSFVEKEFPGDPLEVDIVESPFLLTGTRSHPCVSGNCCCVGDKGLCPDMGMEVINTPLAKINLCQGQGVGKLRIVAGQQKVRLILYKDNSWSTDPNYEIRKDSPLNQNLCKMMGYNQIILKKGMYNMNYNYFKHGHVTIDATIN